jgi:hypothetical protein
LQIRNEETQRRKRKRRQGDWWVVTSFLNKSEILADRRFMHVVKMVQNHWIYSRLQISLDCWIPFQWCVESLPRRFTHYCDDKRKHYDKLALETTRKKVKNGFRNSHNTRLLIIACCDQSQWCWRKNTTWHSPRWWSFSRPSDESMNKCRSSEQAIFNEYH